MPKKSKADMAVEKFRQRLREDFQFYAEKNLKIITKRGTLEPLKLNGPQQYIHKCLEEQKERLGYIRAIVVKARQQGCSTYTAGRFYWNVTNYAYRNAFVLSHASDTTKKLFSLTHRYHEHCMPELKPRTGAFSSTEMKFAGLDSSYYVGTAGSREVGRGSTISYFHGSEVAFWENAETHLTGIFQAIPTGEHAKGSEIILESTANGQSGIFYDLVQSALAGDSEYQVIFTPWMWSPEYSAPAPDDWQPFPEDVPFMEKYKLTRDQMWWRHCKRAELGSDWRFKQEYPATIEEAFQTSGDESWISPQLIMECKERKELKVDNFPRIGAVDPAWTGDRSALIWRQGGKISEVTYHRGVDTVQLASLCIEYINQHALDRLFVDTVGLGAGVYDNLLHQGYRHIVRPCNFAKQAVDLDGDGKPKYLNKRAECWGRLKEHMQSGDFELPLQDELITDLIAPQYHYNNAKAVLQLESKADMRKRGVKSPDGGDALSMTYAEHVRSTMAGGLGQQRNNTGPKVLYDYDVFNHQ